MRYRALGDTPLRTSALGLGLAALGRPGYINIGRDDDLGRDRSPVRLEQQAHAVLSAAWDLGVRYFDVARSYGRGEEFLGGWLKAQAIHSSEITVGSKWGYSYTADWQVKAETHEIKEHSLEVLRRQWEESRALLGEQLDLYQIHSATLDSGVLTNREVLAELVRLRREHGVRIGASLSGPHQVDALRTAMQAEHGGERVFDCFQVTWNLLERSVEAALAEAHRAGVGVIIKEALANGRLVDRDRDPDFRSRRLLLEAEAARLDATLDAVALAAALARPWAATVLSGAATPDQLRSNLAALELSWDDAAEARLAALAEPPEQYWRTRSGLPWN